MKTDDNLNEEIDMLQDKLLLIGASIGQVPLLKKARAKGIHVTVATVPGKYPCIERADDVIS